MTGFAAVAAALHEIAAVIWVGGMFFAYVVLRPAVSGDPPPRRLVLWRNVFARFLPWVWAAVILLLATGYGVVFAAYGSFANAGLHIHLMNGIGTVMVALFLYLVLVPHRAFRDRVAAKDWPHAGANLAAIRRVIAANALLGLINVALGASGRFWG